MESLRRLQVPVVAVIALVFLGLLAPAVPARAGVGVWTSIGPDGGEVWALAVDPGDADIVYAGTRNGVFKSADAGATWTAASRGLGPTGVWVTSIAVTSNAVYAGTYANGLYKSADGGATWVSASRGLPRPEFAVPNVGVLVADPRFPNRIWATAGRGVFLTTDGGQTWQVRRNGLPSNTFARGLVLAPDGRTLYLVNQKAVFKTMDQGKKWTRINKGFSTQGSLGELVLDPANASTLFVASGSGVFRSTNGGTTWKRVLAGRVLALAWQGTRLLAGLASPVRNGIFFSDDRGATWTAAAENPSDPDILELAAGPDLVYAGTPSHDQVGGVFRSLDHGRTWDLSIDGLTSLETFAVAVDPSDPDVLYAGAGLGVFKTTDRGATWGLLDLGLPPVIPIPFQINALLVDPADPSTVYAGSNAGHGALFRSRDAGASWETVDEVPLRVETLVADPRTPGGVWAAGYPGLYHSAGGETWERLDPGGNNFLIHAFAVDPHDPDVLWAGGSTALQSQPDLRLFRSADGGQTWQRRESGLAGGSVLALAIDPLNSNLLLAGTPTGVYRTTEAGLPWRFLPVFAAEVRTIVASPTIPTAFYAHFLGSGVYRTADGGATWTPARRGLWPVPVNQLAVDPSDPRQLYAATQTRGVFAWTEPTP